MILYGFCTAPYGYLAIFGGKAGQFGHAKNLPLFCNKTELLGVDKIGSLGGTRTPDQVINSHTEVPFKSSLYALCTDFVRLTLRILELIAVPKAAYRLEHRTFSRNFKTHLFDGGMTWNVCGKKLKSK